MKEKFNGLIAYFLILSFFVTFVVPYFGEHTRDIKHKGVSSLTKSGSSQNSGSQFPCEELNGEDLIEDCYEQLRDCSNGNKYHFSSLCSIPEIQTFLLTSQFSVSGHSRFSFYFKRVPIYLINHVFNI